MYIYIYIYMYIYIYIYIYIYYINIRCYSDLNSSTLNHVLIIGIKKNRYFCSKVVASFQRVSLFFQEGSFYLLGGFQLRQLRIYKGIPHNFQRGVAQWWLHWPYNHGQNIYDRCVNSRKIFRSMKYFTADTLQSFTALLSKF